MISSSAAVSESSGIVRRRFQAMWAPAAGLLVILFFVALTHEAFRGGFSRDDLSNLHSAWLRGLTGNIADVVLFFRDPPTVARRPVGALFYEGMFAWRGFTPLPYIAACYLILIANLLLIYLWTWQLTVSRLNALLVMLLMSFHGELTALYVNPGLCYDVFCFFFYYLAFSYYLHIRRNGRVPAVRQVVLWSVCYALALGSKEMAVSLPVVILLYELLFYPVRPLRDWLSGGRAALTGIVMTVAFLVGHLSGPNSLVHQPGYQPHFTWPTYRDFVSVQFHRLLYGSSWPEGRIAVGATVVLLLILVFTSRVRMLAAALLLIGILPVALIGQRGLDSTYVALPGLALIISSTLAALTGRLPLQRPYLQAAVFVICFALMIHIHRTYRVRAEYLRPAAEEVENEAADFQRLREVLKPNAHVLILRDGLPESAPWSSGFLAHIVLRNPDLDVRRLDTLPVPLRASDLLGYDVILTNRGGRLVQVPTAEFRDRCLNEPLRCAD